MSEYSYEEMAEACERAASRIGFIASGAFYVESQAEKWRDELLSAAAHLRSLQAKELLAMTAAGDYTGDRVFAGKTLAQVCASDLAPSNDGLLMDDLDSARRLALQFIAELEEAHFVSGTIKRASERITADAQARTDWHRAMDELAEMRAAVAAAEARAQGAEADVISLQKKLIERQHQLLTIRHEAGKVIEILEIESTNEVGYRLSYVDAAIKALYAALAPEPEE